MSDAITHTWGDDINGSYFEATWSDVLDGWSVSLIDHRGRSVELDAFEGEPTWDVWKIQAKFERRQTE